MSARGTKYRQACTEQRAHDMDRLRLIVRWGWFIRSQKSPVAAEDLLGLTVNLSEKAVSLARRFGDEHGNVVAAKVLPEIERVESEIWEFCDDYASDWIKGGLFDI